MKRLFIFCAIIFLMLSCQKPLETDSDLVAVTITSNLVTGGLMTKAENLNAEDAEWFLHLKLPNYFPILLTSSTGEQYRTSINSVIYIPRGTYTITTFTEFYNEVDDTTFISTEGFNPNIGWSHIHSYTNYADNKHIYEWYKTALVNTGNAILSQSPTFSIDAVQTDILEDSTIPIQIHYTCSAIFYDSNENHLVCQNSDTGSSINIDAISTHVNNNSSWRLFYVYNGWCGQNDIDDVIVCLTIPIDESRFNQTDIIISKNNIQKGYYYFIHSTTKDVIEFGGISAEYDIMSDGGNL